MSSSENPSGAKDGDDRVDDGAAGTEDDATGGEGGGSGGGSAGAAMRFSQTPICP